MSALPPPLKEGLTFLAVKCHSAIEHAEKPISGGRSFWRYMYRNAEGLRQGVRGRGCAHA